MTAMMSERPPTPHDLLAFYLEAGVDCALAEEPVNRLSETEAEPAPVRVAALKERPAPPPAPRTDAMPAPDIAIESARELAPKAKSLDDLRGLLEAFDGCALKKTATRLVFGDGNSRARVMFVGEAPGRDEDLQGIPFIGRSGKLLDLMLASIGLDRTRAYVANVIPWRPPGNREPSPHETQMCLPFIRRQIELVDPDVLVCLGKPSSQAVLELKDGIVRSRGRWFDYNTGTRTIRAMATFHPAYLLRQPIYKRMTWKDLRMIRRALAALPPRENT